MMATSWSRKTDDSWSRTELIVSEHSVDPALFLSFSPLMTNSLDRLSTHSLRPCDCLSVQLIAAAAAAVARKLFCPDAPHQPLLSKGEVGNNAAATSLTNVNRAEQDSDARALTGNKRGASDR